MDDRGIQSAIGRWLRRALLVLSLTALTACGAADSQTEDVRPVGPAEEPPSAAQEHLDRLEQAAPEQERLRKELAEMSIAELVELMASESEEEREPFNSHGVREIRRRGERIADELAKEVSSEERPSFLAVLALRLVDREAYRDLDTQMVVDVLVERLRTNAYFNAWGLPHLYWEDAADALVEQGRAAVGPLERLLDDDRRAPAYGSEESVESERFEYRVKDYALALLNRIRDRDAELAESPEARDEQVENYRAQS